MTNRWPSRIAALSLWALAALSATYWLLKVIGISEAPVLAGAVSTDTPAVGLNDLARSLGSDATGGAIAAVAGVAVAQAPDPSARMRLLGIVAGRRSGGVALISIDGQVPRPYRVGSQVDSHHTLARVATRSASFSPIRPDGQAFTLELPSTSPEEPPRPVGFGGSTAGRLPGPARANPVPLAAGPIAAPKPNNAASAPADGDDEKTKD